MNQFDFMICELKRMAEGVETNQNQNKNLVENLLLKGYAITQGKQNKVTV